MAKAHELISARVRAKLEDARVGRLATLDSEQKPHIIPICFAYDESVFYSAIDRKPKHVHPSRLARLTNIAKNSSVALLVDHYDEDWNRLWYILVRGEAHVVSTQEERLRAIDRLRAKYPQYDTKMLVADATVLRITPARITSWGNI